MTLIFIFWKKKASGILTCKSHRILPSNIYYIQLPIHHLQALFRERKPRGKGIYSVVLEYL